MPAKKIFHDSRLPIKPKIVPITFSKPIRSPLINPIKFVSAQSMNETEKSPPVTLSSSKSRKVIPNIYTPPHLRRNSNNISSENKSDANRSGDKTNTKDMKSKINRARRPDQQVYVPRALRNSMGSSSIPSPYPITQENIGETHDRSEDGQTKNNVPTPMEICRNTQERYLDSSLRGYIDNKPNINAEKNIHTGSNKSSCDNSVYCDIKEEYCKFRPIDIKSNTIQDIKRTFPSNNDNIVNNSIDYDMKENENEPLKLLEMKTNQQIHSEPNETNMDHSMALVKNKKDKVISRSNDMMNRSKNVIDNYDTGINKSDLIMSDKTRGSSTIETCTVSKVTFNRHKSIGRDISPADQRNVENEDEFYKENDLVLSDKTRESSTNETRRTNRVTLNRHNFIRRYRSTGDGEIVKNLDEINSCPIKHNIDTTHVNNNSNNKLDFDSNPEISCFSDKELTENSASKTWNKMKDESFENSNEIIKTDDLKNDHLYLANDHNEFIKNSKNTNNNYRKSFPNTFEYEFSDISDSNVLNTNRNNDEDGIRNKSKNIDEPTLLRDESSLLEEDFNSEADNELREDHEMYGEKILHQVKELERNPSNVIGNEDISMEFEYASIQKNNLVKDILKNSSDSDLDHTQYMFNQSIEHVLDRDSKDDKYIDIKEIKNRCNENVNSDKIMIETSFEKCDFPISIENSNFIVPKLMTNQINDVPDIVTNENTLPIVTPFVPDISNNDLSCINTIEKETFSDHTNENSTHADNDEVSLVSNPGPSEDMSQHSSHPISESFKLVDKFSEATVPNNNVQDIKEAPSIVRIENSEIPNKIRVIETNTNEIIKSEIVSQEPIPSLKDPNEMEATSVLINNQSLTAQSSTLAGVKSTDASTQTFGQNISSMIQSDSKIAPPREEVNSSRGTPSKQPILDPDECDWETLYDDDGECLVPDIMNELMDKMGKVSVQRTSSDYKEFQSMEERTSDGECLLEIYGFSSSFTTRDLMEVFAPYHRTSFELKWVDDTHAIGIFSSPLIADEVLNTNLLNVKTRPLKDASPASKCKVKQLNLIGLPAGPRPKTCLASARRLVSGALGIRVQVSESKREEERKILRDAREKKRQEQKQRQDIWEKD